MVVSKGVDDAYCAAHPGTCYSLSLKLSGGATWLSYTGKTYSYTLNVTNNGPATVQTPTVYLEPWQITSNFAGCSVTSPVTVITSASPQPNSVVQGQAPGGRTAGQWILGNLAPGASKKVASFTATWPSCFISHSTTNLNTWATSPSRPGYTWSNYLGVGFF
jgi:hypothetical protein